MNFCRRCGAALQQEGEGYTCASGHSIFNNPRPTVGVFFISQAGDVVLSRRGIQPHKGKLDAVGGFVDVNETLEQALIREIREETGLQPTDYSPLTYLCSATDSYHYDGDNLPVLTTLFYTTLKAGAVITPQDDISEVVSRPLATINLDEIGSEDIKQGIQALQKHLATVVQ